jgi:transcriptional regulator with XRE-family HTH domain
MAQRQSYVARLLAEEMKDPEFARHWEEVRNRRVLSQTFVHMRKSAGLTQQQLADRTGWRQPFVARLETVASATLPNPETIQKFAAACGYSLSFIFTNPQLQDSTVVALDDQAADTTGMDLARELEQAREAMEALLSSISISPEPELEFGDRVEPASHPAKARRNVEAKRS